MRQSPLREVHDRYGARLTEFAGWEMPLQFSGTAAEHRAVRERAGVFDLCHMARLLVTGPDAVHLLHAATPTSFDRLIPGQARYTVVLTPSGGIVDDIIVTRMGAEAFHLCVNAVNRKAVTDRLAELTVSLDVRVRDETDTTAQIAVQGPRSGELIRPLLSSPFPGFMQRVSGRFEEVEVGISRTGYTGELGVELFLPVTAAPPLWEHLVRAATPCGLGARDILRLEMGYPLYGHELDTTTSPIEAGLSWLVDWKRDNLPGAARLRADRENPARRLAGFMLVERGIPRSGCAVWARDREVGTVTSGNMGWSVDGGRGIGLAYLPPELAEPGTPIEIDVRGRRLPARVARPPFYTGGSLKNPMD